MSRRVTLFLSILLICFCVSSVFAQESAGIVGDASTTATEPPAGSIPTTSATDNLKSNEQDYLYKKKVQNTVGVSYTRNKNHSRHYNSNCISNHMHQLFLFQFWHHFLYIY